MEAEGKGAMRPSAEQIKAGIGGSAAEGVDAQGLIYADRIQGLERWIEQRAVTLNYMRFKGQSPVRLWFSLSNRRLTSVRSSIQDSKRAVNFHREFIEHCSATYSSTTNWLAHLDIDE
jgi:hypothetical protein